MVLTRILRAGEGKILRHLKAIADHIDDIESDFVDLTDAELRGKTDEFRKRLADDETLDDVLPEAFATVREAAKRTIGQRHYPVQLMGGAALHMGNVAEMKTGEGKTLVGTLPAYLNALSGGGVHVVTVNDYLAKRDSDWMGRIHHFLGLTVGVIVSQLPTEQRRAAYAADITYGTNNEFGFDYLRDNMALNAEALVQRGHSYAIVDEIDSILIDEARTPLIISGPAELNNRWYLEFARLVPLMKRDEHYEVEEGKRTVAVTEEGVEFVEDQLGIDNLYDTVNTPLVGYLNNALKAKELYERDRDYIVSNQDVLIVDEFTGRILHGRRYNEGIHQAIEAKEGVRIKEENQTLATITLQNYFRLYAKLSGMTGTAQTEAAELHQTYNLGVVSIPTNKPMIRQDQSDVIYKSEEMKFAKAVEDIVARHKAGQPVLVGTTSVAKSEYLSAQLLRRGVPHEVLNAKYHEKEATIIAQAGRKSAVTVATNMAGRGTDIMLGGNPEFIADSELRKRGLSPTETPEEYEAAWDAAVKDAKNRVKEEHDDVVEAGGLYVLGTERHESRRIDNQLRGRSGRQGDPGESRFYLSLQDDLMRRFNAATVEVLMTRLRVPEDQPLESKMVSRAIKSAQTQVEQQNHEQRKTVLKYDEVLNKQREVIYAERRRVLDGIDLHTHIRYMIDDVVTAYVDAVTGEGYPEDWDYDKLWEALTSLYPAEITLEEVTKAAGGSLSDITPELLLDQIKTDSHAAYDRREEEITPEYMRQVERRIVLNVLDTKWREHLYEMDYLKEGIGLRGLAQRDPLVEFKREGYEMFSTMMDGIKEDSVRYLFSAQITVQRADEGQEQPSEEVATESAPRQAGAQKPQRPAGTGRSRRARRARPNPMPSPHRRADDNLVAPGLSTPRLENLQYSAPSLDSPAPKPGAEAAQQPATAVNEPGRNDPCFCGSGKKYKRCHGMPGAR